MKNKYETEKDAFIQIEDNVTIQKLMNYVLQF